MKISKSSPNHVKRSKRSGAGQNKQLEARHDPWKASSSSVSSDSPCPTRQEANSPIQPILRDVRKSEMSKYKGVYRSGRKKFIAMICSNGKQKSLGTFHDEYEAGLAYARALHLKKETNRAVRYVTKWRGRYSKYALVMISGPEMTTTVIKDLFESNVAAEKYRREYLKKNHSS